MVKEVGLKLTSSNYTLKITIFDNNFLKSSNLKTFLYISDKNERTKERT